MSSYQYELKNVYLGYASLLPKEYQQVEYIWSSWSQYINTLYSLDTNDKVNNLEIYMKATHSWSWNFIWVNNNWYVAMEVVSSATTTLRCFIWNSSTYTDHTWLHDNNTTIDEITYTYTSSLATFKINNNTYTQSRSNWYNNWAYPLTIFCRKTSSWTEQYLTMKLYSCYIKNWLEKVRDFVPCYRKSDNVIWLYDVVNKQFYTNSWSGSFTKWGNIN